MAIELNEIYQFFGIENEPENFESFKEVVNGKIKEIARTSAIQDDEVKSAFAREFFGKTKRFYKKIAKEKGIELPEDEETHEGLFAAALDNVISTSTQRLSELEKQIKEPNEALEELKKELAKRENRIAEYKGQLDATLNEYNDYKENTANQFKSYKINEVKKKVDSSIPWASDLNPYAKKGFEVSLNEKYSWDIIDEEVYPVVNGKRIENPSKVGSFMTVEDVYKSEAEKAGLVIKNPQAQTNNKVITTQPVKERTTPARPVISIGNKL